METFNSRMYEGRRSTLKIRVHKSNFGGHPLALFHFEFIHNYTERISTVNNVGFHALGVLKRIDRSFLWIVGVPTASFVEIGWIFPIDYRFIMNLESLEADP